MQIFFNCQRMINNYLINSWKLNENQMKKEKKEFTVLEKKKNYFIIKYDS